MDCSCVKQCREPRIERGRLCTLVVIAGRQTSPCAVAHLPPLPSCQSRKFQLVSQWRLLLHINALPLRYRTDCRAYVALSALIALIIHCAPHDGRGLQTRLRRCVKNPKGDETRRDETRMQGEARGSAPVLVAAHSPSLPFRPSSPSASRRSRGRAGESDRD